MNDVPERIWLQSDTKNHLSELRELEVQPVSDVLSAFTEYLSRTYHNALVAEAYEAAAVIASDNVAATVKAAAIRAMTPSDALAAREARDAKMRDRGRKEALREAAQRIKSMTLVVPPDAIGAREAARVIRGQCARTLHALIEGDDMSALSPAPVDPLEVAELQSRLARLEADNAAATTWGAAVGARYAEIKAIRKRLRALSEGEG